MYDHIGLKVRNIEASVRFYTAALAPLGHVLCSRSKAPGLHVAFRAPDKTAVERFHKAGLEAGGSDHGSPGLRSDYSPTYYAAFLVDPDGNNVEAVCTR